MGPAAQSEKIMFEVYREHTSGRGYRVVYFTELDEHNREHEIDDAMRGEHVFDGYLRSRSKDEAKQAVSRILQRLNMGEALSPSEIERELKPYMA